MSTYNEIIGLMNANNKLASQLWADLIKAQWASSNTDSQANA